jgi:hypothetical protein
VSLDAKDFVKMTITTSTETTPWFLRAFGLPRYREVTRTVYAGVGGIFVDRVVVYRP